MQYFRMFLQLYRPSGIGSLVLLLERADYSTLRYLRSYWTAKDLMVYADERPQPTLRNRALLVFLFLGVLFQLMVATALLVQGLFADLPEAVPFGLALLVCYPVVWAHLLALVYALHKIVWSLLHPKIIGRSLICTFLEWQVVRLRRAHQFKVVAVAGSIGKTSTKLAIAHTLETTRRVIYQTGNYNDRVTVPLVIFGQQLPGLLNVPAWLRLFAANERTIKLPSFYDIAVVELGTDHPGEIRRFAYLQPDLTVVTAITEEHMEYFRTLDAVAREELAVCEFSKQVLVNADDTDADYLKGKDVLTYGTGGRCTFQAHGYVPDGLNGGTVTVVLQTVPPFKERAAILGGQGVKILLAAAATAELMGLKEADIKKGLREVKPFAGRMQILSGIHGSTIIDDTYNASPLPVTAALDVLYAAKAPQRIAILGSMNELGDYSPEAHRLVGAHCNKGKLDLVITIGADARDYLAPVAEAKGCNVLSVMSPYQAGKLVAAELKKGGVVLAEGSQNGVFAEEALKPLLKHPADANKLVRQSAFWMAQKRAQFADAA